MPSTHDGEHSSGGWGRTWRRGFVALIGSVAVVASALPATTQAIAAPKAQVTAEPSGVSFTLEGCRNDGSITLPNASGQYVCPDGVYTSGNLGKGSSTSRRNSLRARPNSTPWSLSVPHFPTR